MKYKGFTYTPAPKTAWDNLSMQEKSEMMKVAVKNGITDLKTIREKYNEFAKGGNLYAGTSTDNDLVDWIIKEEGFTAKPTDIGDGKMTIGSGLTSQKWHNLYKKRGNKWSETDNRSAVAQEVADRRRWAEKNIPNWDTLPESSQKALLAYKYNYDFNASNSPKLFKALRDSNLHEAARQMDATSKDPKFQKGLMNRRKREQAWFLSDVGMPDVVPSSTPIIAQPVSTSVYNPYPVKVQNTTVAPRMVPDKDSYVKAHQLTEQEVHQQKLQERWDAINRFNILMDMLNIQNNPLKQFTSSNPIFSGIEGLIHKDGGKIYIKPENKGKFTALKERTGHSATWFKEYGTPAQKKMAVFALNSRHWKHGLGGNLFEEAGQMQIGRPFWQSQTRQPSFFNFDFPINGGTLPEVVVTGKKPERRQLPAALKKQIEAGIRESYTESNDNAWVDSPLTYKKKNPHLSRKAEEGAKQHAAWEKEHPNLTAWGNVAGAIPFAVAAYPLAATAGSGIAAIGDAAATTSAGQTITAGLAPIATVATTNVAGAPLYTWADIGLSSLMSAHGAETAIEEGGVSPMTAVELVPLTKLAKPVVNTINSSYTTLTEKYPGIYQYPRYAIGKFKYGFDAELPTVYRKLKGDIVPTVDVNGIVSFTKKPSRFRYVENGKDPLITNFTTDVPVRSHGAGNWDTGDVYAFSGKKLLGRNVVSTRPSDTFTSGREVKMPAKDVTLISGKQALLDDAKQRGFNTFTSRNLIDKATKAEQELQNATSNSRFSFSKEEGFYSDYADALRDATRQLYKAPTLKDYKFMDYVFKPKYTSEVEPLSNLNIYMNQVSASIPTWFGEAVGNASARNILSDMDNVLYHPTSPVESRWRRENGIELLRDIPLVVRESWTK